MDNKYAQKIINAYREGTINKYMANKLMGVADSGITDDLCDDLISDAQLASSAGIHSDEEYGSYFYAGALADGILKDTFGMSVSPKEKNDLCRFITSHKNNDNYDLSNLTDYRILTHKWLCDRIDKRAHPNTQGMDVRQTQFDINKWIDTLKGVYASLHKNKKLTKDSAVNMHTSEWDSDEVFKFKNWMRYYEEGTPEKYNVKNARLDITKEAYDTMPIPSAWQRDRSNADAQISTYMPEKQTRKDKDIEMAKALKIRMRSRLRSFRRLLDRYCDVLSGGDFDSIQDELYALDKSVNKLNAYASVEDCIIRSANKIKKLGFPEGAEILYKVAQEPDVLQSLPAGESPVPDLPMGTKPQINTTMVINRLEGLSKVLKSRDTIRELASIDILLNEMGIASYFPELTDAQAKLIESFGYASNKIEAIIAKMRGSGTSKPAPQKPPAQLPGATKSPIPKPKPLETGEMMAKPVGEVKQTLPKV